ncbi:hypothetical protein PG5_61350 [Pseudomonas sp. G5(2012)]|nr:hypothetical protein PG5_61350 [Pseudomonas sp. G5(2012)]
MAIEARVRYARLPSTGVYAVVAWRKNRQLVWAQVVHGNFAQLDM